MFHRDDEEEEEEEEEEREEEEEDAIKRTIIVLYLQYLRHNQLQENYAIHKSSFFFFNFHSAPFEVQNVVPRKTGNN